MKIKNIVFSFLSIILLAACGGGGGGGGTGGGSSGGGSTPTPTPAPTPAPKYDASVFVPEGQTESYVGFLFDKRDDYAGCLSSIELNLTNTNGFLSATSLFANEWRYIGYGYDENGNIESGLRLGRNRLTSDGVEPGTYFSIPLEDTTLNGITISEGNFNPYTYEPEDADDLEVFSADLYLDMSTTSGYFCHPSLRMGLSALPSASRNSNDEVFVGTSEDSSSYQFLYLVSKGYWDSGTNNLPSESDLFNVNYAGFEIYHSYMSNPNFILPTTGFQVLTRIIENVGNASLSERLTLTGSRVTNSINITDNTPFDSSLFTKFLYTGEDDWSSQRIFLQGFADPDCFRSESRYRNCDIKDFEIFFLSPDKEGLVGFELGGYNGSTETTHSRIYFKND